jgi:hypothetical protein
MRKARAFSAGSVIRAVALGAALCAAAVAPGCTRESFNLLQVDAAGASAAGATNAASGAANAGDAAGSASGAKDLDAGASRGGNRNGFGGFHGGAGASTTQLGGGGNQEPCLPGDQCTDGGLNCPPSVQYCKRCTSNNDCDGEARFCDVQDGRCAECRVHGDDCPPGDICHPLTLRCMHSCNASADCVFDHTPPQPQCDPFGACVSCIDAADCRQITGHPNDVCAFGDCADCYEDKQCPPQRPYCVGLICQTKR